MICDLQDSRSVTRMCRISLRRRLGCVAGLLKRHTLAHRRVSALAEVRCKLTRPAEKAIFVSRIAGYTAGGKIPICGSKQKKQMATVA